MGPTVTFLQLQDPTEEITETATGIADAVVEALPRIGVAIVVFAIGYLIARATRAITRISLARTKSPSFSTVISKMIGWIIETLAMMLAITVVFPSVRPVDVLASLGFVSIAVGFAFQDILENLLAGLLLLFREPFRSGDQIEVVGHSGTVQRITIRETEIRTFGGRKVLIPNADVYKNALVIQTAYDAIRSDFTVGIAYESDLDRARRVIAEALAGVEGVRPEPAPEAVLVRLGASTVDLEVHLWTSPQQHDVIAVTNRAIAAVKVALDDAGVEMPSEILALQATTSFAAALHGGHVTPGGAATTK